jgi:hypothetical protein
MNVEIIRLPYPGSHASAREILNLAEAYRAAALTLFSTGCRGRSPAAAPARLCAVHAIELYLNAYLRKSGVPAEQIRSGRHDLGERVPQVAALGLTFRTKTARHLVRMTAAREYLIVRYGPEQACTVSETTRLTATLEEVAGKIRAKLASVVLPGPVFSFTTTSVPGASASS